MFIFIVKSCSFTHFQNLRKEKYEPTHEILVQVFIAYLHFRSNPLMNLQIFATVHSLMNNINLIGSCQAHLSVQYVVIDSEPHLSRTCNTSRLLAPLVVLVHSGYSAFSFNTPTKPLIRLHIKDKTVFLS